jgi:hypothetical protein
VLAQYNILTPCRRNIFDRPEVVSHESVFLRRSLRTSLTPRIADHPADAEQDEYTAKHTGDPIDSGQNGIWRSAARDQSQDKCDTALSTDVGPVGRAVMKLSE